MRKIGKDVDVVVGEVDAFLVACCAEVLNGGDLVAYGVAKTNVSTGSPLRCKCSDLPLPGHRLGARHTSEIELALFEWIEVRKGVVLDELRGKPHGRNWL